MAEQKQQPKDAERVVLARQAMQGMKRTLLRFRALMDEQLKPRGVTTAQIQVLFAIRSAPGSSGAQLARSCFMTPQSMQAMLKQLENAGLIIRGKDPVNDRIVTARVAPDGELLARRVEKLSAKIQDSMWHGISDAELLSLNSVLDGCLVNLGEPV